MLLVIYIHRMIASYNIRTNIDIEHVFMPLIDTDTPIGIL